MLLNMKKRNNTLMLSYENESDYFKIRDDLEDEFYNQFDEKIRMELFLNDTLMDAYDREVMKQSHRTYFHSCNYSLRELLNNFKAIVKVYGDYLILDYEFKGVHLSNDDKEMNHCWFDADDEEFEDSVFNCHLLGEPLSKFVKVLQNQTKMGNIRVERIRCELLSHKPTKGKRQRRRTNIPRGLRHEVFKRDNYTCVECGARKSDGATLHVDHKIPVSKGGTDELDNLQTLCSDCNLNKSDVIQ